MEAKERDALVRYYAALAGVLPREGCLLNELHAPAKGLVDFVQNLEEHITRTGAKAGMGVHLTPGPAHGPEGTQQGIGTLLSAMALYPGLRGRYITCSTFVEAQKSRFADGQDADDTDSDLEGLLQPELLVLDKIGLEHRTGSKYAVHAVNRLLTERIQLARPTIAVSSLTNNAEWVQIYGVPSFVMLNEDFDMLTYKDGRWHKTSGPDRAAR